MEFEDSKNALFTEPNAYIQHCGDHNDKHAKKIVFAEPYETVPNFYINNNFKKHQCECVHKEPIKPCNHENKHNTNNLFGLFNGFNIQGLLPLLSKLGGAGGGSLNNVMNLFNTKNDSGGMFNSIAGLFSKPEMFAGITSLLSGKGLLARKEVNINKEVKSTDVEINNYTRVD